VKRRAERNRQMKSRKAEGDIIHFYKVSGAGNHFVLLDVRNNSLPMARRALARALCMGGHSVGADGVLFIEKSSTADFKLLYCNADGGQASMCGNGARCAAAYAFQEGIAKTNMTFETPCGIIEARARRGSVELNMGPPRGLREKVVVSTSAGKLEGSVVNTGVPHFVTMVGDVKKLAVDSLGRELRYHRIFRPEGVNVEFVQMNPDGSLLMRTYERGVEGETLACGTGAVAVAVCLGVRGLVGSPVRILTRGGDALRVKYMDKSNPLSSSLLEGPAQVVYEGDIPVSVLRRVTRRL
jgi:diaminopimelate epimerase